MSRGAKSPNTTTPRDAYMMATSRKERRMKPVTGATCRPEFKTIAVSCERLDFADEEVSRGGAATGACLQLELVWAVAGSNQTRGSRTSRTPLLVGRQLPATCNTANCQEGMGTHEQEAGTALVWAAKRVGLHTLQPPTPEPTLTRVVVMMLSRFCMDSTLISLTMTSKMQMPWMLE